ncbi:MAG TPA: LysM peptidoglycan-binding domain-containing M23 family metallopeptidase, partial [Stellaceae bacterium]|nr:LysM peptidoglycan-binding domain-containing M23 family metallopeptidase [Stellaceae bacterium]
MAAKPAPRPPIAHPDRITVEGDEMLYAIARRYDVPVRSLIEANGLQPPYRLAAGRTLILPQLHQHVVQPGETLYSISRRHGVDTSTLAAVNGIGPPYTVRVGAALVLPAPVETRGAPVVQATAPFAAYAKPAEPAPVAVAREEAPPREPTAREEALLPPAPVANPEPAKPAEAEAPPSPPPPKPEQTAALPPPKHEGTATLPPPEPAAPAGARTFLWPVHGRIIAAYGSGAGGTHNDGVNIAAPAGTTVVAADAGTVAYAGNELRGYGNLVLVKHADGWMTAYAHNSVLLVKRGDKVRRGQAIARVGATGAVGEPQLHFEIRHGTRAL